MTVASRQSDGSGAFQSWVFIALGSNIGESAILVGQAFRNLRLLSDYPLRCSSFYRTEPVDCPPGSPWFINAVAGFIPRVGESPESLLIQLQVLETASGRLPKTIPNEARPLDLDIVAFGQESRDTPNLVLPHPRALQRRFVLEPLAEIAPDYIFPGQILTVRQLADRLQNHHPVFRLAES